MNAVDGKVRTEFEKILERDHGVSREEDRELINGLWVNLKGEAKAEAERLGRTGVQDLVDDARETDLYRYYMDGKRGKSSIGSSKTTTTGYPEGLRRLDDEVLSDGGTASDSKLKATTKARVAALSEYLSRIVATDQAVVRFRARVLGGPENTLSPKEATELMRSLAAEQQPSLPRDARTLWWSGDEATQAEPITVWPGSELWYLKRISSRLAKRYPWTEDQACYLVLTGQPIKAATLGGRVSESATGVAAHRYHRNTITLEIDAWMPSEYVRQAYHNVQHDLLGENNRQPELRNVEVFCFVVRQSQLQVVDREEGLAKLTIPEWKALRKLWNEQYPEGHKWHYGKNREHRFSRDFYRGQEAVIGTRDGLPGVQSQPMSRAEVQGIDKRLIRALKSHVEKHGNR